MTAPPQPQNNDYYDDNDDGFSDDNESNEDENPKKYNKNVIEKQKKKEIKEKKEKIRFRFEPTKTSLTKIELKDSASAASDTTITTNTLTNNRKNINMMPTAASNAINKDQNQIPIRKKTPLIPVPLPKHKMMPTASSVASLKRKSLKKK